jgi:flagellar biosynthesis component FlhA
MIAMILVPLGVITVVASMILPLPPFVLDFLLVGNLLLALVLFFSALYLVEPVKLSVLPSLLLLATMYRLSLNISSTRLILSGGSAGEVISAFGQLVTNGSLIVGAVVFLVITLVQFIVIAKGAERVAEVSARFTLDALPGKQMSIDADVRSGLIDFHQARTKREDLQVESRFYGALDGAMKFVKGDAIAGMIITAINVVGGLAIGIAVQGLEPTVALTRYTTLTVGDGLLSQLPALLNSLAAGMIVTRVSREGGESLSQELLSQLGSNIQVRFLVATLSLLLAAVPALPALPFLLFGVFLAVSGMSSTNAQQISQESAVTTQRFVPEPVPVVQVLVPKEKGAELQSRGDVMRWKRQLQEIAYEQYGLLVSPPDIRVNEDLSEDMIHLRFRGQEEERVKLSDAENENLLKSPFVRLLEKNCPEFVDDVLTRRMLDAAETWGPELVSSLVPDLVTVTQITVLLRELIRESISVRNFDVILQAIAESDAHERGERLLLETVRIALKRDISAYVREYANTSVAYALSPLIDICLYRAECGSERVPGHLPPQILDSIKNEKQTVLCSSGARGLLRDLLRAGGRKNPVIAHEELTADIVFGQIKTIDLEEEMEEEPLAA